MKRPAVHSRRFAALVVISLALLAAALQAISKELKR
jgi:hypothetical protein